MGESPRPMRKANSLRMNGAKLAASWSCARGNLASASALKEIVLTGHTCHLLRFESAQTAQTANREKATSDKGAVNRSLFILIVLFVRARPASVKGDLSFLARNRAATPKIPELEPILRTGQVAKAMRVSTRVIRKWADAGMIDCYRTIGGHRLFPISEVRRVLDELRGRKDTV